MIDFNDLIPRSPTKTDPQQTGLIDFNDLIPTSQTVQEKQIPSVEPTAEDLEVYRRMGLKQYTSPSGKIYPLTEQPTLERGKVYEAPTEGIRTQEVPSTIPAEPLTQIDIAEQQELEQRNALYKYMRENPEAIRNIQRQNENKVIQDYFTDLPKPRTPYEARERQSRSTMALEGQDDSYWRKTYLAKARRAQIKKLKEQGLIPDERREYKGFWDELGRNTAGGSLNVASGLTGTLASISEGAIWDPDKLEQWAQKLHKKSKKVAYTAAKGGGWRGFVAASVGQAFPYMAASTASVLVTGQPYAAFGVGFSVEGDNAYRDALEAGATEEQAQMNRLVVGTINGAIEQIQVSQVFRFARAGKGSIREVSRLAQQRAMKKIAQKGGKLTLNALQHSAREALEEVLQETTSIAAEARINPEAWNNATDRILRAGAGGGVVGLGFGTAGRVLGRRAALQRPTEPITGPEGIKPWSEPIERPGEVAKRRRVEILPRKTEILTRIDEAIKRAPEAKDYDQTKKPSVRFEIDGGANIQDNKDALKQFRQRVAQLPETELWPKAVTHKVGKKKPIAATREKVGELVKAPEGWFTDGRILVKGKPPAKAKRVEDWGKRTPVDIDDIIHAPTEPAEFQHYAISDPAYGEGISERPVPHIEEPGERGPIAVFKSGDKYFVYDQDRYNLLRNRYPDAEYGINADRGLLVAYMGRDNPVAVLMGITIDKAEGPGMAEPPVKLEPLPEERVATEEKKPPKGQITIQDAINYYENKIATEKRKETDRFYEGEIGRLKRRLAKGEKFVTDPTVSPFEKLIKKPAAVEPKAPEKIEPLKTYHAEVELPNKEKAAFDYQYIEYPKTGQHEYGFNFHNKTIGDPKTGIIHHSAKATEVDAAGGPIKYARQWAAKRYAEVKPVAKAKVKDPDKYREQLIAKWGEKEFDKVWFELAEGGENERFSDIDARVSELDEAGKWDDPETKRLRIEMDSIVDAELEKREAKAKHEEPTEEPSLFVPPTARGKLDFEDLIPDVKHIKNVVVDTFRDWPKGIKKVGKDYWVEVMAVAKQLATPYRYRALRQTMLGVFRHKKKPVPKVVGIEVQDVTDALTATHELAHNIDWLLNNKIFPSSIKARFPDATTGEMSLRNELKKISKVLRPDMWERPKAYIKSHVELMADFISHYILDPEKVRELAPNLTRAFEAKLAAKPELFDTISRLQESRYTGPEEPPIAKHIREVFPLPKEFTPLKLAVDMTKDSYVKAAEELGITAVRHYKLLIQRAQNEADRIDELVPDKARQTDLVVLAENGSKNPWTGKTRQEILKEGLTAGERKAIKLFRAYQEKARQTVNKYLRGADIAEYIKFIEDYFIHAYQTPLTEKYKTAIARWAKRSPQAKKRILPDLAKSVEIGLKPRAKTLSEGLKLWAGINYRVMTNKAFLRVLPQITNDDGVSILQKPQDYPSWPTVDYWPIRQNYAVPLPGRGILLFQGRVAIDPRVKPFIDAMFGRKFFNTPVRIIEGLNATWKAFQLTLFSFFHHQAEFFSACGALGRRAIPFVGGYYGKRARVFGKRPRLWGIFPAHIGVLKAGKQLEKTPEFMDDYLAHGGQRGYISTEGINLMERMLKRAADYLENIIQYRPTTPLTGVYAAAYVPVKTAQAAYSFHQSLLWDNVNRAKLVTYYQIVADGAKNSNLPIKDVKEIAIKYINDNYGGQEWLNTMFRNPKTRQFFTQLMMSHDWTWSQIKTARWPFGIGEKDAARRAFVRKTGIKHWWRYLVAIGACTIAGSFAITGKGPWENEIGHKLDFDWTKIWRSLPWNRDWKERGDYARRYTVLGKAGRELVRWVTSPLRAFGYKLSPVARSMFEQTTGYNVGSDWAEPWAREDLQLYQEVYARFKHLMENFKPFAFSGNNAFLALPSRKGMTSWKATRTYEDIYKARAIIAMGGIGGKIAKANQILKKDENKLRVEIEHACKLNNVDMEKADRAALAGVRSKYYRLFWKATEMPEKKAVKLCNDYANALLELGVTPKGFKQSLRYRSQELPEKSKELGVQLFHDAAANE